MSILLKNSINLRGLRQNILTTRHADMGEKGQQKRLYLPKSKCQKFLNNIGEKVLANFPVQATIHFYNDDTDSEDEEETSSA
ncbi:UNVERIFIED_CONTAM: hypothetical protein H355_000331 [Colinus virginianus]|nr:hypothetical protein H355_000331 [Colinus virginianus]